MEAANVCANLQFFNTSTAIKRSSVVIPSITYNFRNLKLSCSFIIFICERLQCYNDGCRIDLQRINVQYRYLLRLFSGVLSK